MALQYYYLFYYFLYLIQFKKFHNFLIVFVKVNHLPIQSMLNSILKNHLDYSFMVMELLYLSINLIIILI